MLAGTHRLVRACNGVKIHVSHVNRAVHAHLTRLHAIGKLLAPLGFRDLNGV